MSNIKCAWIAIRKSKSTPAGLGLFCSQHSNTKVTARKTTARGGGLELFRRQIHTPRGEEGSGIRK